MRGRRLTRRWAGRARRFDGAECSVRRFRQAHRPALEVAAEGRFFLARTSRGVNCEKSTIGFGRY